MKKILSAMALLLINNHVLATIVLQPPGDGGIIDKIVGLFQIFITTFTGPGAIIISVVSIVIGIAAYMTDPRELWVKILMKIVVVSVVILNIGFWITLFKFS